MSTVAVRKNRILLVSMAVIALTASACVPLVRVGGGGAGAPCHEGTWELTSQTIADAVTSVFGDLSVTPDDDGMILELADDNTFSFSGDQTLGISGATPIGVIDGVVDATVSASGVYVAGSDTLTFTLGSLSGSAHFAGTFNGMLLSVSWSLAQSGLDDIYGLSGAASFTCTATQLTLDFGDVAWEF